MFKYRKKFRLMDQAGEAGDGGNAGGSPAPGAGGDPTPGDAGGAKPTEAEAKLLKEVMEKKEALKKAREEAKAAAEAAEQLKAQLKQFEGIDLNKVKELLTAESRRAEEEALKRGEFDKVRQQMIEQHQAELARVQKEAEAKIAELTGALNGHVSTITELTIGRSFGESAYVRDELTLTPAKARVVYGQHFEVQGGKVIAYDKPAGATDRTMLVDGKGEPLSFDAALEKLVSLDPDKDHLIKSKVKPGAGSSNEGGKGGKPAAAEVGSGRERIAAALSGKTLFKK